jgi:hypothetical protein
MIAIIVVNPYFHNVVFTMHPYGTLANRCAPVLVVPGVSLT